jgi:hypothetical protein
MERIPFVGTGDVVPAVRFAQVVLGCNPTEAKAAISRLLVSFKEAEGLLRRTVRIPDFDEPTPLVTRQQASRLYALLQEPVAIVAPEPSLEAIWSASRLGQQTFRVLVRD